MTNFKHFLLRLLMLNRILGLVFSDQWTALIESVPGMKAACDKLKLLVQALEQKLAKYRDIITGVATEKRLARKSLAEISFQIMAAARSWAVKNSNFQLAETLDYSLPELLKLGFQTILDVTANAQNKIEPHLADLVPFGISQAQFDLWKSKHSDLNAYMKNGPKSAINQRRALGEEMLNDMKTTMDFFDNQLTPLTANFINTPAFYLSFRNDSIVGEGNTHHTRLIAHCQSELGNPFYGLTVTVDQFTDPETGKTYAADSAITDPNGDAEVIEFFAGNRTVTISGPNIETTTFPAIQFERGKAISKTFIVRPAFTNIPAPAQNPENVSNS
ncbi:MAG TPA: hypothetical protein VJY62_19320 [Bacteroidia bacterium]|nr:hypothetical protein [Bacteroidia bacterium]